VAELAEAVAEAAEQDAAEGECGEGYAGVANCATTLASGPRARKKT
jgi:hypothetical protein